MIELTKDNLRIDSEMEVDSKNGREIIVYIEPWFDVDEKYNINTRDFDDVWLNMYGRYNPFEDSLKIECEIDRPDGADYFTYTPTQTEDRVIKEMINEKIKSCYHISSKEFCVFSGDQL